MANIVLNLSDRQSAVSLESVHFSHSLLSESRYSYRGKGLSSILCRHSFQWSPAVRALSLLVLRTKCGDLSRGKWPTQSLPALAGVQGSPAASLDYALSKRPLWLLDMFGVSAAGDALANSLFARWNSERKRGGEVIISLHPQQLSPKGIEITLNGAPLSLRGLECLSSRMESEREGRVDCKHSLTGDLLSIYSESQAK